MTIRRTSSGSGITEKSVLSFDDERDKEDPEIAAAIERGTLEGWLASVERECFRTMAQAGLPTYHGSYLYDADGNWRDPSPPLRGSLANEVWPIARARGHEPDSEVGFAARMLGDIVWLKRARDRGDHDRAALFAGYLKAKEVERRIKLQHERAWKTGSKIHEKAGDSRRGMSRAERVAAVDALCAQGMRKTKAFAEVAHREKLTPKAIETDYYKSRKAS